MDSLFVNCQFTVTINEYSSAYYYYYYYYYLFFIIIIITKIYIFICKMVKSIVKLNPRRIIMVIYLVQSCIKHIVFESCVNSVITNKEVDPNVIHQMYLFILMCNTVE